MRTKIRRHRIRLNPDTVCKDPQFIKLVTTRKIAAGSRPDEKTATLICKLRLDKDVLKLFSSHKSESRRDADMTAMSVNDNTITTVNLGKLRQKKSGPQCQ